MCNTILLNLHAIQEEKGELPRHLRLQLDNCAKDNKIHTVLGFLALLVQQGVVAEVQVGTLHLYIMHAKGTDSHILNTGMFGPIAF